MEPSRTLAAESRTADRHLNSRASGRRHRADRRAPWQNGCVAVAGIAIYNRDRDWVRRIGAAGLHSLWGQCFVAVIAGGTDAMFGVRPAVCSSSAVCGYCRIDAVGQPDCSSVGADTSRLGVPNTDFLLVIPTVQGPGSSDSERAAGSSFPGGRPSTRQPRTRASSGGQPPSTI